MKCRDVHINALIKEKGNFLIYVILDCSAWRKFHVIPNIQSTIESRRKLLVGTINKRLTDKESRRTTTYFQYMKIGPADARISNFDSNIVRPWIRHIRLPQLKSVILHVEAEEFHLPGSYARMITNSASLSNIYISVSSRVYVYILVPCADA